MYKLTGLPPEEGEKLNKILHEQGVACLSFDLKAMSIEEAINGHYEILTDEKQIERIKQIMH